MAAIDRAEEGFATSSLPTISSQEELEAYQRQLATSKAARCCLQSLCQLLFSLDIVLRCTGAAVLGVWPGSLLGRGVGQKSAFVCRPPSAGAKSPGQQAAEATPRAREPHEAASSGITEGVWPSHL